jgi:sporulation protein YlmC with PRC-barrel domain
MIRETEKTQEKKLRGSGGYAMARVTDEEQKMGNLGGPELFLAGIGRLQDDRFSKYYCNKCEKEYPGSPSINYENPNEELGEGVILIEKGEYKCQTCKSTIAQYRKFDASSGSQEGKDSSKTHGKSQLPVGAANSGSTSVEQVHTNKRPVSATVSSFTSPGEFIPIGLLVGMPAYDAEAMLIGKVQEIGLRKSFGGRVQISIRIKKDGKVNVNDANREAIDVSWSNVSKIGDIVLVDTTKNESNTRSSANNLSMGCKSCGYQNNEDAIYCEECGSRLRSP